MGSRCWVSCNGRKRCFPHEGCRPSRCIHLPAEAGSGSGVRLHQTRRASAVVTCLVAVVLRAGGSGWGPVVVWTGAGGDFSIHALTFDESRTKSTVVTSKLRISFALHPGYALRPCRSAKPTP